MKIDIYKLQPATFLKNITVFKNIGDESSCRDNTNDDITTIDTLYRTFTCSSISSTILTKIISFSQYLSTVTFTFKTNNDGQNDGGVLIKYSGLCSH